MFGTDKGVRLGRLLDHFAQEAVRADAEMQLLQRQGWRDLNKGVPLAEGLDHLEFLGMTEVKVTFSLEPVRPGRLARLWQWLRGSVQPIKTSFRICRDGQGTGQALHVSMTMGRGADGRMAVVARPDNASLESTSVSDISV